MKTYFNKFSNLFSIVCIALLFTGLDCFAGSEDKPIVIRKKINADDAKLSAAASVTTRQKIKPYVPADKIDPFKPLFLSKSKVEENDAEPTHVIDARLDKEPLENLELSQLKLTGIISASDRNIALVQEASGRGYVINKGTRIGTKGGKVADILKDKVIVGEKMRDIKGNIFIRKTELKLNRKL